jgi:hypothetical protein
LHLLSREKAIGFLAAERVLEYAKSQGMQATPSCLDALGWLILEPVIEDD